MKNSISWVFTVVVMAMCLTLSMGTLLFGPSEAGANEQLSQKPELNDKDGNWNPDFLSDTATWFSDHFFLRQELISAHNGLSAKLLHTSGSDGVILGKDGWLFYADTMADYTGSDPMTDWELYAAANNLALIAEYAEKTGRDFLFVCAPNKNAIYSQYMPRVEAAAQQDIYRLFALLDKMDVPYVDLHTAFIEAQEQIYFQHDSHWNSRGAALAADMINEAFGMESNYAADSFSNEKPHSGDLYEMLYPAFFDPETDAVYGGELDFTYTSGATKPDSITLLTLGKGQKDLLAYRDSFGNLLYPYLADSYGEARFSRSPVYDLTLEADKVLIELVQRNLRYLITYLPVIKSPARDIVIPAEASGSILLQYENRKSPEGHCCISGRLEAEVDSKVYVVCDGIAYEALLHKDGFAVYVPEGVAPEAVVYSVGGEYKLLTA